MDGYVVDFTDSYEKQLERRIEAFEQMNTDQHIELGIQDTTIDALTAKIGRLQDLVIRLADRVT